MKKIGLLLILLLMIMNLGLVSYASVNDQNEEIEKYNLTESRKKGSGNEKYLELNEKILDANFEKNYKIGVEQDKIVEEIIEKYTSKESKASSIVKKDKIESMYEIIKILDSINIKPEEQQKLVAYVNKYAPYSSDANLIKYNKSIQNDAKVKFTSTRSSYSPNLAVDYAHTYYDSFNTGSYPNLNGLGGDCANFVSQCLYAGGLTTDNEWYITKLNSNNPAPQNVNDLNASWDLADPSPWISASEFNTYWDSRSDSVDEFTGSYVYNNASSIYSKPYYKGDAVQILKKKFWWYEGYHTMIITAYDGSNKDFLLSGHTNPIKDKSLNDIASRYTDSKYKFKFFSVK